MHARGAGWGCMRLKGPSFNDVNRGQAEDAPIEASRFRQISKRLSRPLAHVHRPTSITCTSIAALRRAQKGSWASQYPQPHF